MSAVRVLHVTARTPYARKLRSEVVQLVNGAATPLDVPVPRDASLSWLMANRPWGWFDALHLHHLDFETATTLNAALTECRRAGKPVVFTAHDVTPVFGERGDHCRKLRILAEQDVPMVTLTPGADRQTRLSLGGAAQTVLLPHGYVVPPEEAVTQRQADRAPGPTRFLIWGSTRRNRDIEMVLHCWRFSRRLHDSTLHLLLRAPSRASLGEEFPAWRAIREHSADPRLVVDVLPFPTDEEVAEAVAGADCLVLPYRWASHSGQLELGFDLDVLSVAARSGYLPDQAEHLAGLTAEPIWFDWSDGTKFEYGARLLTALEQAHTLTQNGRNRPDGPAFFAHRRCEHELLMATYERLYRGEPAGPIGEDR